MELECLLPSPKDFLREIYPEADEQSTFSDTISLSTPNYVLVSQAVYSI
jgi:hypothetical protein